MALIDLLETLAALYNRGVVSLPFAALNIRAKNVRELLDLAVYFGIEFVGTNPIKREELERMETEYIKMRVSS